MKRVGGLFEAAVSFESLREAFRRASKGKRLRPSSAQFFRHLEVELLRLKEELQAETWRPGEHACFTIRDPKERLISVPPFRDRVVHHAVIGVLEPVLEARFDFDSYGCRKGRGMDRALLRAQRLSRIHAFVLKTDVRQFFPSIGHEVIRGLYQRIVKDRRMLRLLDRIVAGHEPGLPIGTLTSQWLANLTLTPLDRMLRVLPGARGQVRYMDDVLVFGDGRTELRAVAVEMEGFLGAELGLRLKERATVIRRTRNGVPFLGFRVMPGSIEVRRETFRRFRQGVRRAEWEWRQGRLTTCELSSSTGSRIAHLSRGRSARLRRAFFARSPPMEW